ncbi:MAG: AEC family transporter, partial [Bacteroidota bacterium]
MNFVLIALCLFAGWILRVKNILPENAYKSINAWIVYIALPSVALHYIPTITWNTDLLLAVTMPLIVWSGAWIVLTLASRLFHIPAATKTALLLTAGLGNTSFVGFPLTQAYYGNEGFRIAVVCDQLTFIVLSTAGVLTAMHAA